jgi:hypothetical protein
MFEDVMNSESWYSDPAILAVSFSKLQELGIKVDAENIFKIVRAGPNQEITKIFSAIAQTIAMAERLQSMTSQEQGQASPSGISATESSFLAGAKENMEEDISNALDQGRAAWKRIIYESWMACGEDTVTLPVINRYPLGVIQRAGFVPVEEDTDDLGGQMVYGSITGSKLKLQHDFIFTSRDGTDRANNTQSAEAIIRLLTAITNAPEPVVAATLKKMGASKYFELINEAARLSSNIDLKLEVQPGEPDEFMVEDEQQTMALIQRMAQQLEKHDELIQRITEMISGSLPITNGASPPARR